MPATASRTSQRCSMQKRMMRSNMGPPAQCVCSALALPSSALRMKVLEAATWSPAFRPLSTSTLLPSVRPTFDGRRDEPARHGLEDDRLVVDGLHGLGADDQRRGLASPQHGDRDEQARPPGALRVVQRHSRARGARLLAEQRAHVATRCHRPCCRTPTRRP